jgi:hypothetical protein
MKEKVRRVAKICMLRKILEATGNGHWMKKPPPLQVRVRRSFSFSFRNGENVSENRFNKNRKKIQAKPALRRGKAAIG